MVDDEEAIREQIGGFIKKWNPDFDISGFTTGEGLLAAGKDFDVSAFHYLLKPIEEQKFMEVLGRAEEEARKRKGQKERQIFIRAKNRGYTLKLNRILYIESRGKKVEVHTTDMEDIIESYATMDELEGQLGGGFYRCHRGYLVNMAHIARYDSDSIFLSSGEKVYLTRKKHNEFVKAYMWYLQNGGVSCV